MLDGLRPLIDLADEDAYASAWWLATAHDLDALDAIIVDELDRRNRQPARRLGVGVAHHPG